jgi:opacity protein-like surface antigen
MKKVILSIVILAAVVSCAFAASLVEPETISVPLSLKTDQAAQAIIVAGCVDKHWVPAVVSPTVIDATLNVRQHSVTVRIVYSKSGYTIDYKDSTNLDYNAKKNRIHSKYNQWVSNLNKAIISHIDFANFTNK